MNDNDFVIRKNTVFERPSGFRLCHTDDPENSQLIISGQPVKTFVCQYNNNHGFWTGQFIGMFYAIFAKDAYHFPGYLYKNIVMSGEDNLNRNPRGQFFQIFS